MWGTSSRGGKQRKNSTWSLDRIAGEILKAAEWYLDPVVCTKEMLLKNAAIIGQCLLTIGFEVPEIGFFAARDQFCDVLHCSVCPKPKRLVALRFLEVCESQAVTNHEPQHRELRKGWNSPRPQWGPWKLRRIYWKNLPLLGSFGWGRIHGVTEMNKGSKERQ